MATRRITRTKPCRRRPSAERTTHVWQDLSLAPSHSTAGKSTGGTAVVAADAAPFRSLLSFRMPFADIAPHRKRKRSKQMNENETYRTLTVHAHTPIVPYLNTMIITRRHPTHARP
ncbi:uncharacterized protein LOC119647028 [Hermetia illucens]|uniref:uncharacterized protein LOC119647028 n=1 Tax=Hermetia illucens TaxID=343691 RepID=UPI0018CC2C5A|nr:uncharacterized protein LOC119647028 [Hermetia illucens]